MVAWKFNGSQKMLEIRDMVIKNSLCRWAGMLLLAGFAVAEAAPNIPSSDLPGRERERFNESPVERFMQPTRKPEPLIRWQCDTGKSKAKKQKAKQGVC